ncbi:MAG: hypothetical protein ACLVJ4_02730 [Mediterraneibacter sp.]
MNYFKYFEDILCSESNLYTTKKGIFNFVQNAGEIWAYNTFNTKFKLIEQYLYFGSFDFSNPMYLSLIQLVLPDCEEVLCIHKMMFNYLQSHSFIKFKKGECSIEGYKMSKFSWRIPHHFMPIFSAYLLSATKHKESTPENFFNSFDEYLSKSFRYVFFPFSDEMFKVYYNWGDQYLGQSYFYTLDELYKKYSDITVKQNVLQNSTLGLTLLLAQNSMTCASLSSYLITMLKTYDRILASYPYDVLCDYEKAMPIVSEFNFIYTYFDSLNFLSKRLLDKIQNNIKTNHLNSSSYDIAINNFEDMSVQYKHTLERISYIANSFKKNFETFFQDTYDDPQTAKSIQSRRLTIHKDIEQARISQISKGVQKYYKQIIADFRSFIKSQETSCSSNAANHRTLTLDINYMDKLKENIKNDLSHFKEYIDKESQNFPTILSISCLGEIYLWAYPFDNWKPKHILRLIYSISSKYDLEWPDTLINRIRNNGFTFPLSQNKIADFLTRFNDILDGF